MSCSNNDLKAYFLGEASCEERQAVEQHLPACAACREELERLRLTGRALASVRDEEMPRRIAFVSDKVFEPRWYQKLWQSAPAMGFVSAAMLAGAILVHALYQPPAPVAGLADAQLQARVETAVAARLVEAVEKAVAEARVLEEETVARRIGDAVQKLEFQQAADRAAIEETFRAVSNKLGMLVKSIPYADASLRRMP